MPTPWQKPSRVARSIRASLSVLAERAWPSLNKHQGVRAGLAWNKDVAELTRQHNDANVLVLPGRFIDNNTAGKIMDAFFKANFEGGRHERRVNKIPVEAK